MLILHVYMKVAPEQRDVFLEKSSQVTAGTLAEEGNISYHLYEDTKQPNTFILVEKWKDAESLQHHQQTAHFQEYVSSSKNLLLGPPQIEKYEVSTT